MWSDSDSSVLVKIFETAWACLNQSFEVMGFKTSIFMLMVSTLIIWLVIHLVFEVSNGGDPGKGKA